jgi:hypothetical protein
MSVEVLPPKSVSYDVVSARAVDPDKLTDFAARVWPERPRERILESWWLRAAPECSVAAIAGGRMVGLCAGRPSEWVIGARVHPAVAMCDWYVAPDHEGRLLGRRLIRRFDAPDRMLYGFSISEVAINYLSRLGWAGPYASSLMLLLLPRLARLLPLPGGAGDPHVEQYEVVGGGALGALAAELEAIEARRIGIAHMARGAADWSWRLSVCGERRYRFYVARRGGEPIGYVAMRRLTPGASRALGRLEAAILTDLVTVNDEPAVLHALARKAVEFAAESRVTVVLAATTSLAHQRALVRTGFLSPRLPLLGPRLQRRAPVFMWLPKGVAAALSPDAIEITFADSDVDLAL